MILDMLRGDRAGGALLRARHRACCSRRPTTRGGASRSATGSRSTRYAGERIDGPVGNATRTPAAGCARSAPLERALERPPTPGSPACGATRRAARAEHAEARLGHGARQVEGGAAGRLDREGRLALHRRARRPLQPAARPRLRVDRLHPLHRPRRRPRGPLGRHRPDRVRPPPPGADHMSAPTAAPTHLQVLEAEAIHIMREVAAELENPVLLFSGGKDSIVLLRLAEKAFRPGAVPVPDHARGHGPQLPRGDRVPRPPRRRARRAADRRLRAGVDRQGPRGRGDRPARLAQPAADRHAARRDRRARLRRRVRRRPPRRGARAGQGADLLLPRRLRPVGPAAPARPSCGASTTAASGAASTCACSRSPTGPSSTCGEYIARRGPGDPADLLRARARGVRARRDALRGRRTSSSAWTARSRSRSGCATAPWAT